MQTNEKHIYIGNLLFIKTNTLSDGKPVYVYDENLGDYTNSRSNSSSSYSSSSYSNLYYDSPIGSSGLNNFSSNSSNSSSVNYSSRGWFGS